jgi:hypothetical protein
MARNLDTTLLEKPEVRRFGKDKNRPGGEQSVCWPELFESSGR